MATSIPKTAGVTRFDIGEINAALAAAFPATESPDQSATRHRWAACPSPLGELVSAIRAISRAGRNCGGCSMPPAWTSRC